MVKHSIKDEYFEWLVDLVCGDRHIENATFRKLLMYLHVIEFVYSIPNDSNRAEDGIDLRYRFGCDFLDDPRHDLGGNCTVLEMMIALSIRCEETIMDDPEYGDRTSQWFWKMIVNLGLGSMLDSRFDRDYVDEVIDRFLKREYESDGRGGLFTVRNCNNDLRDVEIWVQMLWFLDNIA